jgi:hypothetical protein
MVYAGSSGSGVLCDPGELRHDEPFVVGAWVTPGFAAFPAKLIT